MLCSRSLHSDMTEDSTPDITLARYTRDQLLYNAFGYGNSYGQDDLRIDYG